MKLQDLLFMDDNICNEQLLYFRYNNKMCKYSIDTEEIIFDYSKNESEYFFEDERLVGLSSKTISLSKSPNFDNDIIPEESGIVFFEEGSSLSSDTYFNSFSIGKWIKYTCLNNLKLSLDVKGAFRLEIFNIIRQNNEQTISELYTEENIQIYKRQNVEVEIPIDECKEGLIYFKLTSLIPCSTLFGGYYFTDTTTISDMINPVKFAVDICTFKREKYIKNNIHEIEHHIINNEHSPLHDKLELFISDNGRSLNYKELNTDYVHVYPNKNIGGAGGFGRSMYEILKVKSTKQFTHIIMMDDDVRLDPHVLERNYCFLQLLNPDYNDAFIAGAMIRNDMVWMQSESGNIWRTMGSSPVKYKYDLRDIKWILKNEKEDTVNYFGWWYCCMPISVVQKDNMPLPIFIKRDDIEYGLRNGRHFININGICVWHDAFEEKVSPYLQYYYIRNACIINSRHRPHFGMTDMLKYFDTTLMDSIEQDIEIYRYKEAHTKLQGIEDFLKGIDWLKNQDGEYLNLVIMNRYLYKKQPVEKLNVTFTHGLYENTLRFSESAKQTEQRISTHNGWDKPIKKEFAIVPISIPSPGMVCGVRRVLYYDEATNTGYITERSEVERDDVKKHCEMVRNNIIENYDRVRDEYDARFEELTHVDFWERYLFQPKEQFDIAEKNWWENSAHFSEGRIQGSKDKLDTMLKEINEQAKYQKQMPIIKNRIVFYLANRRGISCNPKYILKELYKQAGDRLDIIWISDYPETCDILKNMNIPVVKAGSKEHWEYHFTAKIVITNDDLPENFIKRDNQIYINTWHAGMNYKTIGYHSLAPRTDSELKIFKMGNPQPDYYLSGSRFFTDDTSEHFEFDKKVFVPTGMARNDIFFTDYSDIIKKVHNYYDIPEDKKIAIYAPTFRRGFGCGDLIQYDLK